MSSAGSDAGIGAPGAGGAPSGGPAASVHAASFAVSVNDTVDEIHSGGIGCAATGTGTCSLRDAVLFANLHTGASDLTTVTLPAGTYTLTLLGPFDNNGLTGDLDIHANTAILGADAATTIIDGDAIAPGNSTPDRILDVAFPTVHLSVSGVTLQNDKTPASEGGGALSAAAASSCSVSRGRCPVGSRWTIRTAST